MSTAGTVRTYKASVRVGNWQEDKILSEATMAEFCRKRDQGDLGVIRAQDILSKVTAPQALTSHEDDQIRCGDTVAIVHVASGRTLSFVADVLTDFSAPLKCAAAPISGGPQARGAFTIGPDARSGTELGVPICYGTRFSLAVTDPHGDVRCLTSERVSLHGGVSLLSGKQRVDLHITPTVGINDLWEIVDVNPDTRLENEGLPVPVGAPIFIRHVATHISLVALSDFLVRSMLGADWEVVCENAPAGVRAGPLPNSVWAIHTK